MAAQNQNNTEIIEGRGLGNILFGMSRTEIQSILGEPDEIEQFSYTDSEDDYTENWHYDELDLSVGFELEDDWRLSTISVSSDNFTFKNLNLMELNKDEVVARLKEVGIKDLEYEDMSSEELPCHELICSESLGMNFWFDDDELGEIQWGPLFDSNDFVIWPN